MTAGYLPLCAFWNGEAYCSYSVAVLLFYVGELRTDNLSFKWSTSGTRGATCGPDLGQEILDFKITAILDVAWDKRGYTVYVKRRWIICGQGWTVTDCKYSHMLSLPCLFSLTMWLCSFSHHRQHLFLHPLNLGCSWDLFSPVGHEQTNIMQTGCKRPLCIGICTLLLWLEPWDCLVSKPELVWRMNDHMERNTETPSDGHVSEVILYLLDTSQSASWPAQVFPANSS